MKKTISVFVSVLLLAALLQSWAMKESHPATWWEERTERGDFQPPYGHGEGWRDAWRTAKRW